MARKLYVNVDESRLVGGINSGLPPVLDNLVEADNVDYELYFVTASSGDTLFEPLDYASASVKFAVGPNPPSTASAYAVQNTWTNLSSSVTATLARTITGTAAVNEQQKLTLAPEAFDGTFSLTFPSQALTFTSVTAGVFTTSGNHGLAVSQGFVVTGFGTPTGGFTNGDTLFVAQIAASNKIYANTIVTSAAITAYSATTAGTGYTITASTVALAARSTTSQVQEALEALSQVGFGNVDVTGTAGKEYRFSFKNSKGQAALPLMTVAHALTPVYGKSANVNFNTVSLLNAISASASIDGTLEIEITRSGSVETVLQVPVTLRNDLISSGSPSALSPANSFLLSSPDGTVFTVTVDNDGLLQTA